MTTRVTRSSGSSSSISTSASKKQKKASGLDSEGKQYKSLDELWKKELDLEEKGENEKQVNEEKLQSWYKKGADYWMSQSASDDGVLGGFGHISPADLQGSRAFLKQLPGLVFGSALDCGAGIGRISKGLLCPLFKHVDMVEQNEQYVNAAKQQLASISNMRDYYVSGLQSFVFQHQYDVVWIQWVIGHLPDDEFVVFMHKAVAALNRGGYIVVKENTAKKEWIMDLQDQSITRTNELFEQLFAKSNLKIVHTQLQKNFPAALFPVRMYALQPMAWHAAPEGEGDAQQHMQQ